MQKKTRTQIAREVSALLKKPAATKTPARRLDREIAQALGHHRSATSTRTSIGHVGHATKTGAGTGRWNHRSIAQSYSVPEEVVRRIYAAVQTAKHQGLHGGFMADLVERSVGRKLVGGEYTVTARAKEHLHYDPPGGYGGPRPTGAAKEPARAAHDDPKIARASRFVTSANTVIKDILDRRRHATFGWDESNDAKDRALLRQAADELDVAADLYEDAGANIRAGTLHERARHARQADYRLLAAYD